MHLVLQLGKQGALVCVDRQLNVYQHLNVLLLLLGVLLDKLGEGLALDVIVGDSPLAINVVYRDKGGDAKACGLNASVVKRLVKHVCLRVVFGKHLNALVILAVYDLVMLCCDNCFHSSNLLILPWCRRFCRNMR